MTKRTKKGALPALKVSDYQRQQIEAMIESTRARLLAIDPEMPKDGPLWADTLDGESDVIDVLRQIGSRYLDAEAYANACKARIDAMKIRMQRFENVAESNRAALYLLMQAAELPDLPDPEFTASFQDKAPGLPDDIDIANLPEMYIRTERKVNRALLGEHLKNGIKVENVTLDNGGQTLVIRRK